MAAGDLTSLDHVKAFLSVKGVDDDEVLARLITSASAYIKQELNNPILSTTYDERYDGSGRDMLVMPQWPITAITSVSINGAALSASPDGLAYGYMLSDMAIIRLGGVFDKGRRNVRVVYTAGYIETPPEIDQVCVELVALAHRGRARIGEKSRSLGAAGSTTFAEFQLTPMQWRQLKNYNRVAPI